jgi:2-polyprenyl-3-methyl-5-hydroxy-6-metoxy-1,4-benzoquinol methylase
MIHGQGVISYLILGLPFYSFRPSTMTTKKPNVDRFDNRLAAAYSRTENKEQQYDEWAATYDSDLVDDLGYVAHRDAGDVFMERVVDKSAHILDVACGTGLAGEYLFDHGYKNIEGADLSNEMMAVSRNREAYTATWQHDFTKPAKIEKFYEAILCVGMFSFSIPKISHMHNVVNCVQPGGVCVITVNGAAWRDLNLDLEVAREAELHEFTIEEIRTAGYIVNEGIDSRILIIKR